jgi:hypothetical protein
MNQEKERPKTEQVGKVLSETVGVAVITFGGYLVAFYYQKGVFEYFSIPTTLIQLTVTNMLIGITGIWLTAYFLSNMFFLFLSSFVQKSRLSFKIFWSAILLVYLVIFGLMYHFSLNGWLFVLLLFAVFGFFVFLWPPIFSYTGTYSQKLEQSDREEAKVKDLFDVAREKLGGVAVLGFVFIFFVLPLVQAFGYASSAKQKSFPVFIIDLKSCAVVDLASDHLICVLFDEKARTLKKEFYVVPITSAVKIGTENVGPLAKGST